MYEACRRRPDVLRPMLGLYPGSVDGEWKEELDRMVKWRGEGPAQSLRPVALGEIGLDYHFSTEFRKQQLDAFDSQLRLAAEWDLPVNIHLRDATEDFFEVLEGCRGLGLRGNLHAFSGSIETFGRLQRFGDWLIGIGGVVTFRKAALARVVEKVPLDRIILETDAPYLAPTPLRGTRNESANIPLIAEFIAALKGVGVEEVARRTTENAKQLFNL